MFDWNVLLQARKDWSVASLIYLNSFARAFGGDGGTCECRLRKDFWRMSGIIFLARALRITRNHIKPLQTNGGLSSTCMHVRA
jgi:hypothetical protein